MKPIEVGCMVLVVGKCASDDFFIGKVGTVIKRIAPGTPVTGRQGVIIATAAPIWWGLTIHGVTPDPGFRGYAMPSTCLMRIDDDPDGKAKITHVEKSDKAPA